MLLDVSWIMLPPNARLFLPDVGERGSIEQQQGVKLQAPETLRLAQLTHCLRANASENAGSGGFASEDLE